MINQNNSDFLISSVNSPTYINKGEDNWNWNFSNNEKSTNTFKLIYSTIIVISFIFYII